MGKNSIRVIWVIGFPVRAAIFAVLYVLLWVMNPNEMAKPDSDARENLKAILSGRW